MKTRQMVSLARRLPLRLTKRAMVGLVPGLCLTDVGLDSLPPVQ